jgi:hypothetical protein
LLVVHASSSNQAAGRLVAANAIAFCEWVLEALGPEELVSAVELRAPIERDEVVRQRFSRVSARQPFDEPKPK